MRLGQGKDFFGVRNLFAVQNPATNLVDLSLGMRQVGFEISQQHRRNAALTIQALGGRPRALPPAGVEGAASCTLSWPYHLCTVATFSFSSRLSTLSGLPQVRMYSRVAGVVVAFLYKWISIAVFS
jgi:hypothetical protein